MGARAEDANPRSKGEEKGGDGWLVGVRMCVKGTVIVCVCVYVCDKTFCTVLVPMKLLQACKHVNTTRMFLLVFG